MRTRSQKDSENRRRRRQRLERRMKRQDLEFVYYERFLQYIEFANARQAVNIHDLVAAIADGRPPGSVLALQEGALTPQLQAISNEIMRKAQEEESQDAIDEAVDKGELPPDFVPRAENSDEKYPFFIFVDGEPRPYNADSEWYTKVYLPKLDQKDQDMLIKCYQEEYDRIRKAEMVGDVDLFATEIK